MTRVVLVMCLIDRHTASAFKASLAHHYWIAAPVIGTAVGLLQLFKHAERSSSSRDMRDRRGLCDADRGPPTIPAVYSAAVSPVYTGAS